MPDLVHEEIMSIRAENAVGDNDDLSSPAVRLQRDEAALATTDEVENKEAGHAAHATEIPATAAKADDTSAVKQNPNGMDTDDDDDSKYLTGTKLSLLTFGLCLATFVVALDNTIIATAIPRITTQFNSLPDVGWYGSSYLLTTTSLQPFFGKVITYFSVKWVWLSSLLIFESSSPAPNTFNITPFIDHSFSWINIMRHIRQFPDVHRRTSRRWRWRRSIILWRHDHHRIECPSS